MKKSKSKHKNGEFWYGQCAINQEEHDKDPNWDEVHGDRLRVRIPGSNPIFGADQSDEDLQWAYVLRPTNQGFASLGATGLWGGEWVTGVWINDVPYINAWLGNNITRFDIKQSLNQSTEFKKVSRFNGKNTEVPPSSQKPGKSIPGPTESLSLDTQNQVKNKGFPRINSKESYIAVTNTISEPSAIKVINEKAKQNRIIPKNADSNEVYKFSVTV